MRQAVNTDDRVGHALGVIQVVLILGLFAYLAVAALAWVWSGVR